MLFKTQATKCLSHCSVAVKGEGEGDPKTAKHKQNAAGKGSSDAHPGYTQSKQTECCSHMHSCVHLSTVYDREEREAAYVLINSIDRWINNRVRIHKSKASVTEKHVCCQSVGQHRWNQRPLR